MLSQMSPKERFLSLIIGTALLFGFGFIGSQHLRSRPELKIEPAPLNSPAPLSSPDEGEAVVHVVGAVKQPGVIRMKSSDRVQDALAKAGGAKADASLDEINLAAKLVDGTQLLVPRKGMSEEVAEPYRGGGSEAYRARPAASSSPATSGKSEPGVGSISLNSANGSQLDRLPGVGPATAAKILEYRQSHGGFSSVDELLAVKGIGPKKLAAMRKFVRL